MHDIFRAHAVFGALASACERERNVAQVDRIAREILDDAAICKPLRPKRGHRCEVCGDAPRSPFARREHPHDVDVALVRRIAVEYLEEERITDVERVMREAMYGELLPIAEPRGPLSITPQAQCVQAAQQVGAVLAHLEPDVREQRIRAFVKPFAMAYAELARSPTRRERHEVTERVAEILRDNPALRAEDRADIAVQLGEKFGIEEAPVSGLPEVARVRRVCRRRARRRRS